MNDALLLTRYSTARSDEAFRELVDRYWKLVYASCLRRLDGNRADAEEACQAVFVILAQQAAKIRPKKDGQLLWWLFKTSKYVSISALRRRTLKEKHEREAARMKEKQIGKQADSEIRSLLDRFIEKLPAKQARAVLMHFALGMTYDEIAKTTDTNISTVEMRVKAGLDKLRGRFAKHGVDLSCGVLIAGLTDVLDLAPLGFAESVHATAVASVVNGATVPVSTMNLAQGAMKMMFWTKVKTAAAVALTTVVIGATAGVAQGHFSEQPTDGTKIAGQQTIQLADNFSEKGQTTFIKNDEAATDIKNLADEKEQPEPEEKKPEVKEKVTITTHVGEAETTTETDEISPETIFTATKIIFEECLATSIDETRATGDETMLKHMSEQMRNQSDRYKQMLERMKPQIEEQLKLIDDAAQQKKIRDGLSMIEGMAEITSKIADESTAALEEISAQKLQSFKIVAREKDGVRIVDVLDRDGKAIYTGTYQHWVLQREAIFDGKPCTALSTDGKPAFEFPQGAAAKFIRHSYSLSDTDGKTLCRITSNGDATEGRPESARLLVNSGTEITQFAISSVAGKRHPEGLNMLTAGYPGATDISLKLTTNIERRFNEEVKQAKDEAAKKLFRQLADAHLKAQAIIREGREKREALTDADTACGSEAHYREMMLNEFKPGGGEYAVSLENPGAEKRLRVYDKKLKDIFSAPYTAQVTERMLLKNSKSLIAFYADGKQVFAPSEGFPEKAVAGLTVQPTENGVALVIEINKTDDRTNYVESIKNVYEKGAEAFRHQIKIRRLFRETK